MRLAYGVFAGAKRAFCVATGIRCDDGILALPCLNTYESAASYE
jgi:hypothetical protein